MIQRLGTSTMSFKANELSSARDAYKAKLDKNVQTAQKQNDIASNNVSSLGNAQITTQGQAQKLDVIA